MGNNTHSQACMEGFRVADCFLTETDLEGGKFTWEKSRGKSNWVRERLDRAFETSDWWHKFPVGKLTVLYTVTSYHDPISLNLCNVTVSRKNFRFRFKNT